MGTKSIEVDGRGSLVTHFRVLGLICVACGLTCVYESHRLWSGWGGAGLLPAITSMLLAILAVTFFLMRDAERKPFVMPDGDQLRAVAIIAVTFAAYVGLADVLGYLLTTWIALSIITKATSDAGYATSIIWPGILAGGSSFLFRAVGTHLPTGMLGM